MSHKHLKKSIYCLNEVIIFHIKLSFLRILGVWHYPPVTVKTTSSAKPSSHQGLLHLLAFHIFPSVLFSPFSPLCSRQALIISCLSDPGLASFNPSFNHSHTEYKITLLKTLWQLPVAYDKIQPFIMVYKTHQESGPCIPLLGLSFSSGIELLLDQIPSNSKHAMFSPANVFSLHVLSHCLEHLLTPYLANSYSSFKIRLRCTSCAKPFQILTPLSWTS